MWRWVPDSAHDIKHNPVQIEHGQSANDHTDGQKGDRQNLSNPQRCHALKEKEEQCKTPACHHSEKPDVYRVSYLYRIIPFNWYSVKNGGERGEADERQHPEIAPLLYPEWLNNSPYQSRQQEDIYHGTKTQLLYQFCSGIIPVSADTGDPSTQETGGKMLSIQ